MAVCGACGTNSCVRDLLPGSFSQHFFLYRNDCGCVGKIRIGEFSDAIYSIKFRTVSVFAAGS